MTLDPTSPDVQIRLLLGELMLTICQLEAAKAQLTQTNDALLAQLAKHVAASVLSEAPE